MECYLDNAATTRPFPEVCDLVTKVMYDGFGNPSSLHRKGLEGENYVRHAAEQVAGTLKCMAKNIIFTSGGTESNNMALIGTALANRRSGKHIITTCFEHPSVQEPLTYLEKQGFEITYLPVDGSGHVSASELQDALREDTILVSVIMVNNEVGALQDIEELSRVVKSYRDNIYFHADAIQAYGKMAIVPKKLGIDLMSVSGHKIHGPKGSGFLYVGDRVKIHPHLHGGGQQRGMRSGTENVPAIAGLGLAAQMMAAHLQEHREHLYELKKYFVSRIVEVPEAVVNACQPPEFEQTAPHIVSVSFAGVRSEVLLHALEDKGVYVSSGSACSSNHPGISGTLTAIGVEQALLDSTLRFSFSVETTKEELDHAIEQVKELVPVLARYTRK